MNEEVKTPETNSGSTLTYEDIVSAVFYAHEKPELLAGMLASLLLK